jgi:NAD(P)H-dependent flavin oxidoreductase YrpB (nitropropane dioxygenase family)
MACGAAARVSASSTVAPPNFRRLIAHDRATLVAYPIGEADVLNDISPLPGTAGFHTVGRSLPTAFLSEWSGKREEARRDRDRLRGQIVPTTQAGRQHECVLWAGQTAGGIKEILSVGEIMRRLIAETQAALSRAPDLGERA